ncbi:protein MKS1 [Euphorbia lathyris]|uniref:protein MKS1 n=1 Tax=Euphorbia lathyris TaxID=212925 RepID=UPI0033139BAC
MDPHTRYFSTGAKPQPPLQQQSKKHHQILGPRPAPLKLKQASRKISKPPLPPPHQPLIIYSVSPKTIHTEVSDFMAVVQRLTGLSSTDFSCDAQVSPAARLAATEKASPSPRTNTNARDVSVSVSVSDSDAHLMNIVQGLEIAQIPGILSPEPAMLPPVPSGFFSPVTDPNFFNDLINSPYGNIGSYAMSPSGLLSASVVSPLPSPDIFKLFMDF